MQEAFINGVSTRKMERLAQSPGIEGISAGQVSAMTKELDDQVAQFRSRPLEREYPIIWVDALYEKIRFDGRAISMAVLVVAGITVEGHREILACESMMNESEETYRILFDNLKERGMEKVWLCVSDAHKGLRKAFRKAVLGCSWQRCKVHFSFYAEYTGPCITQRERSFCRQAESHLAAADEGGRHSTHAPLVRTGRIQIV